MKFNIVVEVKSPPYAQIYKDFVSADECSQLIAEASNRITKSTVIDNSSGGSVLDPSRTSSGSFFPKYAFPLITDLDRRLSELTGYPEDNGEDLQILRYEIGERYVPHWDYFVTDQAYAEQAVQRGGQRIATVLIYLNTPEEGGTTSFPDAGLTVNATQGSALLFKYPQPVKGSLSLHGGEPVVKGHKWVLTKWYREQAFV